MDKVKYSKVQVSERLPHPMQSVFILHETDVWISGGYVDLEGKWFNDYDQECECYPTDWLEETPDREDELKEILTTYIEEFKAWNFSAETFKRAEQILKELL